MPVVRLELLTLNSWDKCSTIVPLEHKDTLKSFKTLKTHFFGRKNYFYQTKDIFINKNGTLNIKQSHFFYLFTFLSIFYSRHVEAITIGHCLIFLFKQKMMQISE
jgi:hypothetical protein